MTDDEIKAGVSAIINAQADAFLAQTEKTSDQSIIDGLIRRADSHREHAVDFAARPLSELGRHMGLAQLEAHRNVGNALAETAPG